MSKTSDKTPRQKGPIVNGETVKWTSSATGTSKKKEGIVLAYVPVDVGTQQAMLAAGVPSAICHRFSTYAGMHANYVVEVRRTGAKGQVLGSIYYTPLASIVDKANPRAKRA